MSSMVSIGLEYFQRVGRLVNKDSYNSRAEKSRSDISELVFDESELCSEGVATQIKVSLSKNGALLISPSKRSLFKADYLEKILSSMFGAPICDNNPKKKNFSDIKLTPGFSSYASSCLAQPMHTDQGHTKLYPGYLALSCLKSAEVGGLSTLISLDALFCALIEVFGRKVDLLFSKNAIKIVNYDGEHLNKPLLFIGKGGKLGISYSPMLKSLLCSKEVFQQFDFITNYVHKVDKQIRVKLEPGEILLLDNTRFLHARTRFKEESKRVMRRYWFDRNSL